MAVGYGSSTSTGANDQLVSSINVPVPAGVVAGNHVYVALEQWEAGNPTVTPPAGFVAFTPVVSGSQKLKVFVKEATGADAGNYTFSWTGTQWTIGHAVRVTGAKAGNPTGTNFNSASVASGTAIPNTSVTVGFVPGLLQWSCNENSATQTTPPTNFTEVQDSNYLHSNHRMNAATSGTFTAPSGVLSASTLILAFLAAIEPAGGGATVNGTADAPLGALAAAASGGTTVGGTAAASLGSLTASASGTATVSAAATAPLGALASTASGTRGVAGVATALLGALAASATGTVTGAGGGTAAAALGGLAASTPGTVTADATAAAVLGGLVASASGTTVVAATAAAVLGGLTASASGVTFTTGTAVALLGALSAAAVTVLVLPPPDRTLAVPADVRFLAALAESRTFAVPFESRFLEA